MPKKIVTLFIVLVTIAAISFYVFSEKTEQKRNVSGQESTDAEQKASQPTTPAMGRKQSTDIQKKGAGKATAPTITSHAATRTPTPSRSVRDFTQPDSSLVFNQLPLQDLQDFHHLVGNNHAVLLRQGGIDTSKGQVNIPDELRLDPSTRPAGSPIHYLVQFTGPVQPEWKEAIRELGGTLGEYIPNNTYIISMNRDTKDAVGNASYVQWIDYYHPAYKLSETFDNQQLVSQAKRRARNTDNYKRPLEQVPSTPSDQSSTLPEHDTTPLDVTDPASDSRTVLLTVQAFQRTPLPSLFQLVEAIGGTVVVDSSETEKRRLILETQIDTLHETLVSLAQSPAVQWVEPYIPPTLNNNTMHWVVQSNISNQNPLWDQGLTGTGQIVGVGDTGLDVDMAFFWDSSQGIPTATVNNNQRKVISYHDLAGNGDWDQHDHGTHVAGTIAGKSLGTNAAYNGIAYDAKLVFQDIGNGGSLTGIPYDLNTYFQQAYNDGARIHSNSWGSAVDGAYTASSQDADQFMWNHKDFLIIFSAGNSGPNTNTVGSPGTAKNILTSGASQNAHSGYDPENVADFSSNGPTDDGRTKPTVTAPGYYIQSADNDGNITTFNSGIRSMSGTSMSAPTHAGSSALVRQYYTEGFYPSGVATPADAITPSAALIKATMINSAVNGTGSYTDGSIPSTGQGWGRIVLDNTLFFQGDTQTLFIDDFQAGLQSGENTAYDAVSDGTEPLKVTLVWTDYYPSLSAGIQLVNDLDLVVSGPSGTFKGNVFSGGISATGGTHDRLNVEENVLIPSPAQGTYTITVSGYNVPTGPQPFAIVVTGATTNSSIGSITLDNTLYRGASTAVVTVSDADLNTSGGIDTATVTISSTSDPGQAITLTETAPDSATFQASFVISSLLTIADGDTLTASYDDADDGSGNGATVTATATIDLTPPAISGIAASNITTESATISWQTDEASTGIVSFRAEGDSTWQQATSTLATSHAVVISGLSTGTTYEFKVSATDQAGNSVSDDNNGLLYTLKTDVEYSLLSDSLDNGTSLFQLSGGSNTTGENGLWHISSYQYSSAGHAWYYGLESTKTYNTGARNWGHITTTQAIDLGGLTNASLTFKQILKTENYSPYDLATVQVSEDNVNFTTLYQSVGSSSDWETVALDLTSYLDKQIYVRFSFDTQDGTNNSYQGWLVDDIHIVTSAPDDGVSPEVPTNPTISDPGTNALIISWDANTEGDLRGYFVYRDGLQVTATPVTATSYTDSGLNQSTTYSYTVSAVDLSGMESGQSNAVTGTAGSPAAPAGLIGTGGDGQADLSWQPNTENDLAGYNLYQGASGSSDTDLALAANGAAVVSQVFNPGSYLIDGIDDNLNQYTYIQWPGDIIVDLGQIYQLEKVGVHLWDGDNRYYRYQVFLSVDGSNYSEVVDRSTGQQRGYLEDSFPKTSARYIKVRGLYNSMYAYFHATEITAFAPNATKVNPTLITTTSYTVNNLTNGEEQSYFVAAVDTFGNIGPPSPSVAVTPDDGTAPAAPTGVTIADPGDTRLVVSWDANTETDLDGYNLYRDSVKVNSTLLTETSYSDTGTSQGTDYSYTVTAVDLSGHESELSQEVMATAGSPAAPAGVNATDNNGQVSLSWQPNTETDLAGYNLYQQGAGNSDTDVALATSGAAVVSQVLNSGDYLIDGIDDNLSHYAYIQWPGDIIVDLGQSYQLEKVGVHLWDGDNRYYQYRVSISADGTNYTDVIDHSTGQHRGYVEDSFAVTTARFIKVRGLFNSMYAYFHATEITAFAQGATKINPTLITSPTFALDNLINGVEPSFFVAAVDSFGNVGEPSAAVTVTINDQTAPVAPTGVTIADPGDTRLVVNWDANSETDLDGYNLYRNGVKVNDTLLTNTSYSDTATSQGSDYSYTISAVDLSGNESESSQPVQASAGSPAAPTGVGASEANGQVSLSWQPNTETDLAGYNVYQEGGGSSDTDVALAASGATIISQVLNSGTYLIDGIDDNLNQYTYVPCPGDIIVDLGQSYQLERIGVHLWDGDNRYYQYRVSISIDGTNYTEVADRSTGQHRGYVEDSFAATSARYIKVRGLFNSMYAYFHAIEITAFAQGVTKVNSSLVTGTTIPIDNLTNGEAQSFFVAAVDTFGNTSSPSSSAIVTPPDDGNAPAAPTGVTIADPGDTRLVLNWDANAEADLAGYNLYRNGVKVNDALLADTTYSDTGTSQGSDYSYTVSAVDLSANESDPSQVVQATAGSPAAPTGVSATEGNGQVNLSWQPNTETDLAGYNVYQEGGGSSDIDVALAASGATIISQVLNSGTYLIDGIDDNLNQYTYVPCPGDIIVDLGQNYQLERIGVHLWDGDDRYYQYRVSISTDGTNYTEVADRSTGQHRGYVEDSFAATSARYIKVLGLYDSMYAYFHAIEIKAFAQGVTKLNSSLVTSTTLPLDNLTNGETQSFFVAAVDTFGNTSAPSSSANVTPPDDGIPPAPPTGVTIADPGDNRLEVNWDANAEADLDGYNLYRNGVKINDTLLTEASYSDTDTSQGSDYSYTISAVDFSGNESEPSQPVQATAGSPAAPTGVIATAGDSQVSLSWQANTETDLAGYNVYQEGGGSSDTDVALAASGATVISQISNPGGLLIDGIDDNLNQYAYIPWPGDIIVDLGQNYQLTRIGIHLWDGDNRYYQYRISISADGTNYTEVVDRSTGQQRGYLEDTFPATGARYIKVRGLYNSMYGNFHVTEITAFAQTTAMVNQALVTSPSFTVDGLTNGVEQSFYVAAVDTSGNIGELSAVAQAIPLVANAVNDVNESSGDHARGDLSVDLDTDGDGLSDTAEITLYHTDPFLIDSDGDGITDWQEVQNGTDPLRYSPAVASPDPLFDFFTWTLPPGASPKRLGLPAEIDQFLFSPTAGLTGFGLHPKSLVLGLSYVWIDLKQDTPVGSWAYGVVTDVIRDEDGLFTVTIDYGFNLYARHGLLETTNLAVGDAVNAGQTVGFGHTVSAGQETSTFCLVDLGRTDGPPASGGGVMVSPFDYLMDSEKHLLVDKYQREVAERYNPVDAETITWGFEPYQPYLTNKLQLHTAMADKLSGVWRLVSSSASPGYPNDLLAFIEADNPYFTGNIAIARDLVGDQRKSWYLNGTVNIDYASHQLTIFDESGATYYGLFSVDENTTPATLTIEYQKDAYPEGFTENRLLYELVE